MTLLRVIFTIIATACVLCRAQFGQIQKPGKNDICAAFCDDNYKSQTNATDACKQGCSLFSILQLTSEKTDPDENYIRPECVGSCEQSYAGDKKSQEACAAGCRNQTVVLDYRDRMPSWTSERVIDEDDEDQSDNDFLSKMMKSMRKMMDRENVPPTASPAPKVGNSDENGELVVVVHMVPLRAAQDFDVFGDNSGEDSSPPFKQEDTTLTRDSHVIAFEPSPPVVQISPLLDEDDWLACVGRRIRHLSMLTRWMLCLAMILSVAGMIWICMAILRTKPRRHLMYISQKSCSKGGVDNVYYTMPPYTSAADVKSSLECPPTYESVVSDEKKNPVTA